MEVYNDKSELSVSLTVESKRQLEENGNCCASLLLNSRIIGVQDATIPEEMDNDHDEPSPIRIGQITVRGGFYVGCAKYSVIDENSHRD
jgi:hypothetical protein